MDVKELPPRFRQSSKDAAQTLAARMDELSISESKVDVSTTNDSVSPPSFFTSETTPTLDLTAAKERSTSASASASLSASTLSDTPRSNSRVRVTVVPRLSNGHSHSHSHSKNRAHHINNGVRDSDRDCEDNGKPSPNNGKLDIVRAISILKALQGRDARLVTIKSYLLCHNSVARLPSHLQPPEYAQFADQFAIDKHGLLLYKRGPNRMIVALPAHQRAKLISLQQSDAVIGVIREFIRGEDRGDLHKLLPHNILNDLLCGKYALMDSELYYYQNKLRCFMLVYPLQTTSYLAAQRIICYVKRLHIESELQLKLGMQLQHEFEPQELEYWQHKRGAPEQFEYLESQHTLVCSECDFSFSKSIIQKRGGGKNMVCTAWYWYMQWEETIVASIGTGIKEFVANVEHCRAKGAHVTFGIDACQLDASEEDWNKAGADWLDRVLLTFPRVYRDPEHRLFPHLYQRDNAKLMGQILSSINRRLATDGQVHLMLKKGQFRSWKIYNTLKSLDMYIAFWCELNETTLLQYFSAYTPRDTWGNYMNMEGLEMQYCCFKSSKPASARGPGTRTVKMKESQTE